MYQHGLWFPTETRLLLTSELCCPSAPDAAPDFTNSFLLFLGLRSGVIVTAVRCCSSFLPERLCLPSSEHLGQSLFPVVFSCLSLPVVQLYWCVCGYAPRSVSSWNLPASSRLPGGGAPAGIATGRLLLCPGRGSMGFRAVLSFPYLLGVPASEWWESLTSDSSIPSPGQV